MAALQFYCTWSTVSTGTVAKTLGGVKAPANQAIKILELAISFDGNVSGNAPIVVDIYRTSFAANPPGTASTLITAANVPKNDPGRVETVQTAVGITWTTEPTFAAANIIRTIDVGAFNGLYHYINPFAAPIICVGGQGIAIRVTAPNTCNSSGHLLCEE